MTPKNWWKTAASQASALFLILMVLSSALAIEVYTSREVHGTIGSRVTLSCTFWSEEWISDEVSVTWYYRPQNGKDSNSIFHYTKGQAYIDKGIFKERIEWVGNLRKKDGSIVIYNLDDTDNGTFTCDVKNPPDVVGKSSSVQLFVFEKVPIRAGVILGAIIGTALGLVFIVVIVAYLIRYCWLKRQMRVRRELSAMERGKHHKSSKDSKRSRQTPVLYAMLDQSRLVKSSSEKKSRAGDSRRDRK
ncbi:myelin protein P0 [Microcaecilia unicolor]|uniref:Myelin protein P0 n=1 Tax=Microcaecilia unicolor TaxID=1415580 RepID=A0A6P7WYM6_9AMPH|nr:myelin protein P0 [Microcaecilia unicolor]